MKSYSPSFLVVNEAYLTLETKKCDIFIGFWKIIRAMTNVSDAICRLSARVRNISSMNLFFFFSLANNCQRSNVGCRQFDVKIFDILARRSNRKRENTGAYTCRPFPRHNYIFFLFSRDWCSVCTKQRARTTSRLLLLPPSSMNCLTESC